MDKKGDVKKVKKKGDVKQKKVEGIQLHQYKSLRWGLLVLVIVLLLFLNYRYLQEAREEAFIDGGQNAIRLIVDTVNAKGGIVIEYDNASIVLSQYHKAVVREEKPDEEVEDIEEVIEEAAVVEVDLSETINSTISEESNETNSSE
ncbi:MAG: hypothetical protein ACI83O_000173 [Patescibacteria group bacterium]|jgi:hypothetical protein